MISTTSQIKIKVLLSVLIGNVLMFYGFITFPFIEHFKTTLWALAVLNYSMFGITGGVHRYWTHRSFKANLPLRLILAGGWYTMYQMPIQKWVTFHRVHHKYTDTDADPHNSTRGFFFSHMGWVILEKLPDVKQRMKQVDISDLKKDSVVVFGDKYYGIVSILLQVFYIAVPVYYWNEEWHYAVLIQIVRWMLALHMAACVNSFAHLWGDKPYNKNILASDNALVAYITMGEGWHNYHHAFPNDYRMSEFSGFIKYDMTTQFLKFFKNIGWAYDLKTTSDSVIRMTVQNRGDASLVKPY